MKNKEDENIDNKAQDLNYIKGKATNYQKLELIKIGDYSYIYKDQSKINSNLFFYRWQKSNCRITIEIDRDNLDKIAKKNITGEILYKRKKEHKCNNINIINCQKIEECSTEEQINTKAYNIIAINPLKPLIFHKINYLKWIYI